MNDIETKISERNAKLDRGSEFSDNAIMRYMATDFPETVFSTTDGYLRLSLPKDKRDPDNDGEVIVVRITPYKSPRDRYLAKIARYQERDDNTDYLGSTVQSEVFDTADAARGWIVENGVSLDDYPEYVIDDYRD